MRLAAGDRLGSYEIVGTLGAGGMGEVYRARDTRLGREVAIKVLPAEKLSDPARRARFEQEARAVAALNHPHIVTIHEIESAGGVDFIVMELVAGKTLDALIPRHGMRFGEVLRIAIPLADALAAAHGAGIVHRDLKPANVMVTPEGVVKVLDFGLAKLTQAETASSDDDTTLDAQAKLSHPGTVAGTPAYMSPEQATGGPVDARSDIFSFGALLYEMVTGRRPFGGGSTAEMLAALLKEQPRPPGEVATDVPKELERIILRCLRKEPERRFQSVLDVKVELQEVKEESDSAAVAPARPQAGRRRAAWAVGGLAALLIASATAVWLWRIRGVPLPPPRVVPLTALSGDETFPTFSPDGQQVAFSWNGEKEDNRDIYVKMIGSSEMHRLTTDPAADGSPAWSPDGRRIAFVRGGAIHLISPLGGPDRKVSGDLFGGSRSWSPDGRWLAALGPGAGPDAAARSIYLVPVDGGEPRPLTRAQPGGRDLAPAAVAGRAIPRLCRVRHPRSAAAVRRPRPRNGSRPRSSGFAAAAHAPGLHDQRHRLDARRPVARLRHRAGPRRLLSVAGRRRWEPAAGATRGGRAGGAPSRRFGKPPGIQSPVVRRGHRPAQSRRAA